MDPDTPPLEPTPSLWRTTLGFILVGMAWGLTTPFMRRAAVDHTPPKHPSLEAASTSTSRLRLKYYILKLFFAVYDLLRRPAYAVPFLLNITGSIWFFLLIGKTELSLTVPITNSLAFLFTVVGEWWCEGKVIGRDTWMGMVLVLGGIALCVHSKS